MRRDGHHGARHGARHGVRHDVVRDVNGGDIHDRNDGEDHDDGEVHDGRDEVRCDVRRGARLERKLITGVHHSLQLLLS